MENKAFSISRAQLTTPNNQTCLITGGSSGIGLNTAIILHELGNNVVVVDRSPPIPSAPKSVTDSPRFLYQQSDITNWASQRSAFQSAYENFGRIDNVFVNAGIAEYGDQFFKDELDDGGLLREPDRRCVDIDLQAADDTVKLAIYYIRKKEKDGKGKGGSIVMTASLAGYLASAGAPLYSAAKHGTVFSPPPKPCFIPFA
jgi:NAD(P)-dependent dehydrogenase (short-subunit alcohol dehydrogenase family)